MQPFCFPAALYSLIWLGSSVLKVTDQARKKHIQRKLVYDSEEFLKN